MNLTHCLPILTAVCLAGMLLVPSRYANRNVIAFRRWVSVLAGLQFVVCLTLTVVTIVGWVGVAKWTLVDFTTKGSIALTVQFDNLALLMLTLVSFVGWVICQYSIRYLDGESTQGRYFRWTGFAIGSVSLMVISGNLLMFMLAWVMTSTALHKLLLHYSHRPAAQRAAWTKFVISRIGDVALFVALALLYAQFKTLDFSQLFDAVAAQAQSGVAPSTAVSLAAFLLVIGAVTKSAQVPFHTWLPLTMETPTPVSALMHAGIVNAGGFLIIRMSPIVSLQPWAMTLLVIVGGFTACFAAAVMTTQTSVKKKLAYSTIAQMGFMLLQCGLGAFSAAMLHILAHSLYKAHAFLSSGSVMQQRAATNGAVALNTPPPWGQLLVTGLAVSAIVVACFAVFRIDLKAKTGGLVVVGVLVLALTQWVSQVVVTGRPQLLFRTAAGAVLLSITYVASYFVVDKLIAGSVAFRAAPALSGLLSAVILLSFLGLMGLQRAIMSSRKPAWLDGFYVHVSNGFYIENNLRRLLGRLSF